MRLLLLTSGLFAMLAWLAPNKYPPWISFYNDYCMFIALWLAFVCATISARPTAAVPRWLVGATTIMLVPLAQALLGYLPFSGDGYIVTVYLLGFCVAASLTPLWPEISRPKLVAGFAGTVVLAALVSAVIALCQWLQVEVLSIYATDLSAGRYPHANLAQPNNLATLFCMGLAGVLYLFNVRHLDGLAGGLISTLLIIGVAITSSRAPLIITGFTCVWITWKFHWGRSNTQTIVMTSLGAGFYAALFFGGISRIAESMLIADPSQGPITLDQPRLMIWRQALAAIQLRPWLGYGWNQISSAQVAVSANYPSHLPFSSAHNILLDLLLWNGIPLGSMIIGFSGYWLVSRSVQSTTPASQYALLCIGILLIHSMLELPLEYAYFLIPFGYFCGVVEADHLRGKNTPITRRWLWLTILLCLGLMIWIWYEYRVIEEDYRLMRFETLQIGSLKAEHSAPDVVLLNQLQEDIRLARTPARASMSAEELEAMRLVAHRFPYYANLYRYSLALALNNRFDEASLEFKRICNMYPIEQCLIAAQQIKKLTENKYPQLSAWELP